MENSLADVLAWRLGDFGNVSQSNNFSTASAGGNDHDPDMNSIADLGCVGFEQETDGTIMA